MYLAVDRVSGARVALKVLHRAASEARFAEEARILSDLQAPGVVRYVAHGHAQVSMGDPRRVPHPPPDGALYLAMEWIDGESLDARLSRNGPLSIRDALALADRVAQALAAAHGRGVIHRDLKPSNLLLPDGVPGRATLIDFGVALGKAARPSHQGKTVGTPGYMAPEQARGQRDLDARVDVFSMGCVLYECLTGRPAFAGEHPMGVLAKVLLEDPPRVAELRPDVPEGLDALVTQMLSKDRALRPHDGAAMVLALAAVDGPVTLPRGQKAPRARTLGSEEQRLLSLAIAGPAPGAEEGDVAEAPMEALAHALDPFGPHLEQLADGTVVATLVGLGAATDQAAGAARCALAMRAALPDRAVALATGRGVIAGQLPVGEVIDRAARMLGGAGAGAVRIDELTAGLLEPRFVIGGDDRGLTLSGERDLADAGRTLLGRPSPCVGREAELTRLRARLSYCAVERWARAVLVTGPAGVGKSRLRRELMEGLGRDGTPRPTVLLGQGDPSTAGSPFGMLAPALRRTAGVLDGEPAAVQRQKLRALATRHLPPGEGATRVVEFLGELAGVPFPEEASVQLRAARRDAVLMGDQMRRAFEDFVAAECAAGPVLFVLEDLQWGDIPSLGFVGAVLRNLAHAPLFVLALARPEVHEIFPTLWSEYGVEALRLGPLPREAGVLLVRHALNVSDDVAGALAERSGGNAFYLEELIRHVARLGMPSSKDPLPQTVLAMVEARLGGLEPEARRVLRAASVFGQVFYRRGVKALLGEDEAASSGNDGGAGPTPQEALSWTRGIRNAKWTSVDMVLAALEVRELTVRHATSRFPGEVEHAFRSALVRDTAYAMLTQADRTLGHRLAGAWLESAGESSAVVLADHFQRGGEPERAAGCYRRAATQALEGNDLDAAVALADRGIAVMQGREGRGPAEIAGALAALQATAHRWRGRNAESREAGLSALALLPKASPAWYSAAAEIAIASLKLGDAVRLGEIGETLRDLADRGEEGEGHAVAAARVAIQLLYGGRRELSDALFAFLESAAGAAATEPSVIARVDQARAIRALYDGDVEEHLDRMESSARAFEAAGDLRNAHAQRVNTMVAKLEVGAYEDVARAMREAIPSAERMGLVSYAALGRSNLGCALRALGALDEALAVETEAALAYAAQGDRRMEGACRNTLALILSDRGDLDGALREAEDAVDKLSKNVPARAYALATKARILIAQGLPGPALDAAREAMLATLGGIEEGESFVLLVHAEALAAAGEPGSAVAAIAAARARLQARARRILDPGRRRGFLERVPENARTLELARAWVGEG